MKISIIGAGNVGSALAERILAHNLADVVLVDIIEGMAKAKAFDLTDASPLMGYEKRILGTSNFREISGSRVIVITAGFARRPGASREDLAHKNSEIMRGVIEHIKTFSPDSILVVVTNPLDVMTYLAYRTMGCERRNILGMAGNLDTARFRALLSHELGVSFEKIETFVLGTHGDTMVPLVSKTLIDGRPLGSILNKEKIASLVARTKKRGGEIVGLLKSGSAYFSPSAACFEILKALINDQGVAIPCSCVLNGEYGIRDCSIGVPAKIGKDGIEKILEWELPEDELKGLRNSARALRNILNKLV